MINKGWMNEFAYEVKQCPECHQKSLCLIFEGETGEFWECAESRCLFHT